MGPTTPNPNPSATPRRFTRHLPRAALVLFLIAIPVVFRDVLLPFVLAVFCAYLIYPIVWRLERIPFGKRHPPRWLAVITVYTALFIVGRYTIPPLVSTFIEQGRKLLSDVPGQFARIQSKRKELEAFAAAKLEVKSLSKLTRDDLFHEVDALASGTVQAMAPADGRELLPLEPPPKKGAETGKEAPAPTIIQLFPINVNWPPNADGRDGAGNNAKADDHAKEPTNPPAVAPIETTENGTASSDPLAHRFSDEAAHAFKDELKAAIDTELEKPGPAKALPARLEREIVPALAKKHLGLPVDDAQLAIFARNTGIKIAAATAQEDFAALVTRYGAAGIESTRDWVQERVAGLLGVIPGLAAGIFDFFMVLMLTAFFVVFFPRIRDYGASLIAPSFRGDYGQLLDKIDQRLSGSIRGQVIICIINSVLTFPGLLLIGSHTDATNLASYSVLLALMAGVLTMIPIFGVILSTVPMVFLALTQGSWGAALLVIGWISIIHAIEAYILNPNILGHSASMNPILVVFALLSGKHFGGLVGALLAVPIASVIVSLFGYYRRLVAESHAEETGGAVPPDPWGD